MHFILLGLVLARVELLNELSSPFTFGLVHFGVGMIRVPEKMSVGIRTCIRVINSRNAGTVISAKSKLSRVGKGFLEPSVGVSHLDFHVGQIAELGLEQIVVSGD